MTTHYFFLTCQIKDRKRGRAAALVADEELSRDDKRRLRRASKTTNKVRTCHYTAWHCMTFTLPRSATACCALPHHFLTIQPALHTAQFIPFPLPRCVKSQKQKKTKDAADAAEDSHAGAKARRRQEDQRTDEVLRSDSRVVEGTEEGDSSSYAKSAVFFSKLQRTAQEAIGGAMGKGKGGAGKGKKRGYDPDSKDPSGVKQKASGFKL